MPAWRTRTRDAKERKLGDLKKRALLLAVAADRIRERTYAGARVIEIAPIHGAGLDRQGAQPERVEPVAHSSSIDKKLSGDTRRVKIKEVKMEPGEENRTTRFEKKVKTEKMETSDESGKLMQGDQRSSSSKRSDKTRDTSSAKEHSGKDKHKETRGRRERASRGNSKRNKEESDSDGDERKTRHRGRGEEGRNIRW